jgi:hypothetical protein
MKRFTRLILVLVLLAAVLPVGVASAQQPDLAVNCEAFSNPLSPLYIPNSTAVGGYAPSKSQTCIIMPAQWNGGLVIFAHGYVFAYPANKAVEIPWDQLILKDPTTGQPSGTIPAIVLEQGFAFATTSYSKNGLAVKEGVAGVVELVQIFKLMAAPLLPPGAPEIPVFLIGASEGGLVTTLAVEKYPLMFSGGVAACGPVGDFSKQVNYWGDLRAVYDVYFDGRRPDGGNLLGGDAVAIPAITMAGWGSLQAPGPVLARNYSLIQSDLDKVGMRTRRLLSATNAPVDPTNPSTIYQTILGILEYNVMATNEAILELHGNPYTNIDRVYTPTLPDASLNKKVQRVAADSAALNEIGLNYQTSGLLQRPLVLLHTTGDPIVPFWHTAIYAQKVAQQGSLGNFAVIPVERYGHCAFTGAEAKQAFQTMLYLAFPH